MASRTTTIGTFTPCSDFLSNPTQIVPNADRVDGDSNFSLQEDVLPVFPGTVAPPEEPSSLGQDRREFVRLITVNQRKIYGYILSLVTHWADAEEILQETNLRLWEQFEDYDRSRDFAAWACTIASYQVLTYWKKAGRSRLEYSQQFIEAVSDELSQFSRESDARRSALERCLEGLGRTSRQLIDLSYGSGLTIREVAKQLGKTPDSVYKALGRIRRALYDCVQRNLKQEETV